MGKSAKEKSGQLFERELVILREAKTTLADDADNTEKVKEQLSLLVEHYEDLLDQSKLITKVSDQLQHSDIKR